VSFVKIGAGKAVLLLWASLKSHLRVHLTISCHFKCKEILGQVRILRHFCSVTLHSHVRKPSKWSLYPYLFTYLLTAWCRVLVEKLTGLQLVKKFPAFHGTRRFITALTSVRHSSLSWASPIQSTYPHPTPWRSVLI